MWSNHLIQVFLKSYWEKTFKSLLVMKHTAEKMFSGAFITR